MSYEEAIKLLIEGTKSNIGEYKGVADDEEWIIEHRKAIKLVEASTVPQLPEELVWDIIHSLNQHALYAGYEQPGLPVNYEDEDEMVAIFQKCIAKHNERQAEVATQKWKAQICAVRENVWSENAMVYDTPEEVKEWLDGLRSRWFGYDAARIVPESTPNREPVDRNDPQIYQWFRP